MIRPIPIDRQSLNELIPVGITLCNNCYSFAVMEPEVWLTWLYSLYSGNVPIRSDMSKQDYLTDYLEDRNIHYFQYTCIYHWQNPIHPYNKPITK